MNRISETGRTERADILSGVAANALLVAAARGLAARRSNSLVSDRFAEVFCRAAGPHWAALFDDHAPPTVEHPLRSPGFGTFFQEFLAARTRYFDDYLRVAAEGGVRQIVVLGAGLDARAYRSAWPDGTICYEVDRPQVLEFKRCALADDGAEPVAERREVAADLTSHWSAVLRDSGFDPSAATAWLAEGLLLYLSATEQDALFEAIDALSAPGSQIGVEHVTSMPDELYSALAAERAGSLGVARWGRFIRNERRAEPARWFGEHGWVGGRTTLDRYLIAAGRELPAPAVPVRNALAPLITLITAHKVAGRVNLPLLRQP
ncbi:SAM-dependent methyltransferase [Nocardia colli]|uniref:S-adenosyl-L-methionine-dependent methyltransferase n=1 Tax=Nocardia colli TaxID=2545717 RepID=A0A5N0DX15_9NOCA|nr:SAM-dependent methyltransferase [Nocardia colli]KAA8880609.1 SAM-dependent methyltransferase [Nocardia colli]